MPRTRSLATVAGTAVEAPHWSAVLQALREARAVTQEGWAARLGVSLRTVQRWERGERVPDPGAEAGILAYCGERGLFRSYDAGLLAGLNLTAESLQALLAEARLTAGGRSGAAGLAAPPDQRPNSNLPAMTSSFVGREQELAAVRRVQAGTRLLTLTGAGGVGKTRLALELAGELLWAYPHGVWLVELAALADPAPVAETVVRALGVRTTGQRSTTEALIDFIDARHLLLVLDNCEHLLLACAALVEALLRACPHLKIVATSREPLGINGETVWRVPPLSLAAQISDVEACDAVRLFVERAQLYQSAFTLTAMNEPAVMEICQRLDGIPLAIELAAARVVLLAPGQIAERLHDRFRLLTHGSRTALPRQQTLRATLDWSYDLLTASEQALLRQLSVFAGGFALEAAEAVAGLNGGGDDPVLDRLASLIGKSLVLAQGQDGTVRHGMLETVRQYAAEKLDETEEATATRERHRDWCLALATEAEAELRGPHEPDRLARLEEEHDNLRSALRWCQAEKCGVAGLRLAAMLGPFWMEHDHLAEGRDHLAPALVRAKDAPIGLRARALLWLGALGWRQADLAAARHDLDEALALAREVGDSRTIGAALMYAGSVDHAQGDYPAARARLVESLAVAFELDDSRLRAAVLLRLGLISEAESDYRAARAHLEESLTLMRRLGYQRGMSMALNNLGLVAQDQGEFEAARRFHEESLTISRRLGVKWGIAAALGNLGLAAQQQGDRAAAREHHEASLAIGREIGDRRHVANTLINLGIVARAQGDYAAANAYHEESLVLYRAMGDRRGIAYALVSLAVTASRQDDLAMAETLCKEGLAIRSALGDMRAVAECLGLLARLAHERGEQERAARLFGAAEALRAAFGAPLAPGQRAAYERDRDATCVALGAGAFETRYAEGRAMSPEAAVASALADAAPV